MEGPGGLVKGRNRFDAIVVAAGINSRSEAQINFTMAIILIGGGARSGKSRFALDYASDPSQRRAFVATAEARDDEMRERIRSHQAGRGPGWTTIEEPRDLADVPASRSAEFDVLLIDCVTLWLSNILLDAERDTETEIRRLLNTLDEPRNTTIILVTNEVGCGIVPESDIAREFRDLAGRLNQELARRADEVYWMVFGIPVEVKKNRSPAAAETP